MERKRIVEKLFVVMAFCLLAACSPAPPTPTPYPTDIPTDIFCPAPRNWVHYVTQPGDTLRSLAERTSSTVAALATANCLNNPRILDSGQVFYLPRQPITP